MSLAFPTVQVGAQETDSLPGQFTYVKDGRQLILVRGNVDEPLLLMETEPGEEVANPHFSRDGRSLVFCVLTPSNDLPVLYYLDTLTLERHKVTSDGSCSYDWSPDGKTLIYSTPPDAETPASLPDGIWSYSLETREIELLVPRELPVIDPLWSPDGRTISFFDFCSECVGQFYAYDLSSGEIMAWPEDGGENTIGPGVSWSPESRALAHDTALWMYSSAGETYGLDLASNDGSTRKEIYSQPGRGAFFPIWSPDGKSIAFASFESFVIGNYVNRSGDLMAIAPDGSNVRTLYASLYEVFPQAWSPDGRYLLFVERLSVDQSSFEKQQLSLVDVETGSILWKIDINGATSADWAPLPAVEPDVQGVSVSMAGKAGLLFVSRDFALAFFEPVSGQAQKLTASFTGQELSISPDGRTVLFGDQIVSIQSQADGTVSASIVESTNPGDFSRLNWSPDSQKYGYADEQNIWMVDLTGNSTQLGEGSSPPGWSYDGGWMAYCDDEGRLWIAQTGKPADWIVQQDHCMISWSPTQTILAYVTFPARDFANQANGTAFLYNPSGGSTKEIARSVSSVNWSTDGKLVGIRRITSTGTAGFGFSLSAVNPETGQELLIEDFSSQTIGNKGWIDQTNGYLAGKYRFQAELLAKEQLADILFDATLGGDRLLVGSGGNPSIQVSCRVAEGSTEYPLVDVTLQERPGVYAQFSPDGEWILVSSAGSGITANWLARCGTEPPVAFESLAVPSRQYFSPDSQWLVMEQTDVTGEEIPRITLLELGSSQIKEVPSGLHTNSAWFQMPDAPLPAPTTNSPGSSPASSPAPQGETGPLNLQSEVPLLNDSVMMLSFLLWAGALIAIVVLMLYLWRWSPAFRKQAKDPQLEQPLNLKTEQTPEPKPSRQEVENAFRQGVELLHAGRAEEGIVELMKVIAAEPENDTAWFWLGIASARQKDYRAAERCFLQAKRHGHPEADKALDWLKRQYGPLRPSAESGS